MRQCRPVRRVGEMNERRMDNDLKQSGELVRISADVVFHRDVLRMAIPAAANRPGYVVRAPQLALDFPDDEDEDAC
jgi:hypothetical protein